MRTGEKQMCAKATQIVWGWVFLVGFYHSVLCKTASHWCQRLKTLSFKCRTLHSNFRGAAGLFLGTHAGPLGPISRTQNRWRTSWVSFFLQPKATAKPYGNPLGQALAEQQGDASWLGEGRQLLRRSTSEMEPRILEEWSPKKESLDRAGCFLSYVGVNPEQLHWDSHQSNWEQNLATIIHPTSEQGSSLACLSQAFLTSLSGRQEFSFAWFGDLEQPPSNSQLLISKSN